MPSNTGLLQNHQNYDIKVNRVPEEQFDFGYGFGWAFAVYTLGVQARLFAIVLKSFSAERTEANIDRGLELGKKIVQACIDTGRFEPGGYYCYRWEPEGAEPFPVTEVDCETVSPAGFRSP